jgi:hypothetical protein
MIADTSSLQLLGIPVTLEHLVEQLSLEVLTLMLAEDVKTTRVHARRLLAKRSSKERERLTVLAERLWQATRLEKEDLEELAVKHAIPVEKRMAKDLIAYRLIKQLGIDKATQLIEEALRPGEIQRTGMFSSYQAPHKVLAGIDILKFISQMEMGLQTQLSNGRDDRKVKVTALQVLDHLVVHIFFERPNTDGREITTKKQLRMRSYERSAGSTFFRLAQGAQATTLMLRSAQSRMGGWIRQTLGGVLWSNTSAVPSSPTQVYDLNVLLRPSFRPGPISVGGTDISVNRVRLQFIEVLTSTANLVKVSALGGEHDALSDFRMLAEGAALLAKGCDVRLVELKFDCEQPGTRRRVITVQLRPDSIKLDEQYFHVVESHLRAWGLLHGHPTAH